METGTPANLPFGRPADHIFLRTQVRRLRGKSAERKAHLMERFGSRLAVPDQGWLFAGSLLLLEPGATYELRLTLDDPDGKGKGAKVSRVLRAQTRSEAQVPASARQRHVVPGSGGGTGTADDPFRGLAAASKAAVPGDVFLLHSGVYQGPWVINRSPSPGG